MPLESPLPPTMSPTLPPSTIRSVCVYCGSSSHVDNDAKCAARDVGSALGSRKLRVIYGGGRGGLMGPLADSALEAGGQVIGIIPEFIRSNEVEHTGLTELHIVDSMHTRKNMMFEKADAFVVLPGGFGTMDETFEMLTWKQLGLHDKPVVIFNYHEFWTPLLDLLDHMMARGFAPADNARMYAVVDNVADMMKALLDQPHVLMDPSTKWF